MLADLVGRHCESGDIVTPDVELRNPQVGDLVVVPVTGAYCFTMLNNYNGALRPPVIYCSDGIARLGVRRETPDELLAREMGLVPAGGAGTDRREANRAARTQLPPTPSAVSSTSVIVTAAKAPCAITTGSGKLRSGGPRSAAGASTATGPVPVALADRRSCRRGWRALVAARPARYTPSQRTAITSPSVAASPSAAERRPSQPVGVEDQVTDPDQ